MDEFLSLRILDLFSKLFEKSGIDYSMLRMIVKTKMVLDGRSAPVVGNKSQNQNETSKSSFIKNYIGHLIMGVFLAVFIYVINNEMVRMIYFAGAFFFMTTMYLISDFSFVLLDTKDKNILLTKPIDNKTVSITKLIHILIYMFRLNTFIAGPSLIVLTIINGFLVIPIFLVEIILMDLLIFLLTAFIYLLVLRFFDGETLRNIINLIQILLTILVTIGYQIAVRVIDFTSIQNITYNFKPLHYFNPILWFGAPFEIIYSGGRLSYLYVFTTLLIVVPLVCFILYLNLSKSMETLLLKLEGEGKEKRSNHKIEVLIGKLLNRDKVGQQAFYFANAIFRSDRSLKLKIYPALSTGVLVPILMIFNMGMRGQKYEILGFEYIYLYFNFMILPTILHLTQYSSAWKGSYSYITSGFNNIRQIYKGVLQVLVVRILVPLIICNGAIYIVLFKWKFIIDLVVLFLSSIMIIPIISKIYFSTFPFSKPIEESATKQSFGKFMLSILIMGAYALLHFISHLILMGVWIYIGLLIVGIIISWKFAIPKKLQCLVS